MGDSILNGVIERKLSNDRSVKVRNFPGATVDDLRHHRLSIIRKQLKSLIINAELTTLLNLHQPSRHLHVQS